MGVQTYIGITDSEVIGKTAYEIKNVTETHIIFSVHRVNIKTRKPFSKDKLFMIPNDDCWHSPNHTEAASAPPRYTVWQVPGSYGLLLNMYGTRVCLVSNRAPYR